MKGKLMSDQDQNPYLAGKVLLAMPSMSDPRFHKAVIFMCAHDENGAMGLVVNNTLAGLNFENLLEQVGLNADIKPSTDLQVMSGGPVESARGFLLHSSEFFQTDTIRIDDSFSVTGTVDALKEVAAGNGPEQLLFILGYAGWGAGQLDQEIQQNSWLVTDPDPSIIFSEDHDQKWTRAVGQLGFDPAMLSGEAGRA